MWAGSLGVLLPARAEGGSQRTGLEGKEPLSVHPLASDGYTNEGLSPFCQEE